MTTLNTETLEEVERITRQMLVLAKREDWHAVMQQDAERASLLSASTTGKNNALRIKSTSDPLQQASNMDSIKKTDAPGQHRQKLIQSIKKKDARLMAIIHAARDTVAEQGSHHHAQRSAQQHYQTSISL